MGDRRTHEDHASRDTASLLCGNLFAFTMLLP
jgi:hypothetical protein